MDEKYIIYVIPTTGKKMYVPEVEVDSFEVEYPDAVLYEESEEFAQKQEFDAMRAMENNKLSEQRLAIQKDIAIMKDDIARERIDQAAQFKAMDIMRGNR